MTPLRAHLRAATAAAHHRLDTRMGALDLATAEGYGRFLLAQARALPAVERALERAGVERLLPDWPARRRREALGLDLAALGLPEPPEGPGPDLPGEAEAWGAAYVLEGSRLGARVLEPRVGAGMPRAFLRQGAGPDLWRGFLAALEAAPYPLADPARATAGALAAFALFEAAAKTDPETLRA